MKSVQTLLGVILIAAAGTTFAACPQSMSVTETMDCIVSEAALESQGDFQWEAQASVEVDAESEAANANMDAFAMMASIEE